MKANSLPLPKTGVEHAQIVDGMREIASYDISSDAYLAMWDTWINDKKVTLRVRYEGVSNTNTFLNRCRPLVLSFFQALEAEVSHG